MNRFRNAFHAQNGACNALPVANALVEAIREVRDESGGSMDAETKDAAVFLILHQLTFLLTGHDIAMTSALGERYLRSSDELEAKHGR